MLTFLDQVAQTIIESKRDFQELKIVVPSNRAILFLKEAIKKRIEIPRFAPKVISIESFIEELSGLKKISKSELLLLFFEIYRKITPKKKQDQFDQYLGWAEIILNEFSEIDANLVDSSSLFKALEDYKSLDSWNADTLQEKDIVKHFKDFNKTIPILYQKVHEILLEKEQAYSGLRYREAVANLEYYFEADQRHHFFIGFNALNKAEEFLFQEFLAQSSGHLSRLSCIPSLSVSGQPAKAGIPGTSIHLSSKSRIPSRSVSGQPFSEGNPGVSGQSSSLLRIPSPSLSIFSNL